MLPSWTLNKLYSIAYNLKNKNFTKLQSIVCLFFIVYSVFTLGTDWIEIFQGKSYRSSPSESLLFNLENARSF